MHGSARQITAARWEHSRHVRDLFACRRAHAAADAPKLVTEKDQAGHVAAERCQGVVVVVVVFVVGAVRCTSDTISAVV
jgi:hypothetical protein